MLRCLHLHPGMFRRLPVHQCCRLISVQSDFAHLEPKDVLPVSVVGQDVPPPVPTFAAAGFDLALQRSISLQGLRHPTSVQQHAFACIRAGRDVIVNSSTGTGKTLAYLLPALQGLLQLPSNLRRPEGVVGDMNHPPIFIFAPTSELAIQIKHVAQLYGGPIGVRVAEAHADDLARRPHIVVGTPSRVLHHAIRSSALMSLISARYIVFDEADILLSRQEDCLREFARMLPSKPQMALVSATWPPAIEAIAADFMEHYIHLSVGDANASNADVEHTFVPTSVPEKAARLVTLLDDCRTELYTPKVIVFANSASEVDDIARYLYSRGADAVRVHHELMSLQRKTALHAFCTGEASVLICTDLLGRGIDIPQVDIVVNFSLPIDIARFVNRAGRTGRMGSKGRCVSFITVDDGPLLANIADSLECNGKEVPAELMQVAQQFRERRVFARFNSSSLHHQLRDVQPAATSRMRSPPSTGRSGDIQSLREKYLAAKYGSGPASAGNAAEKDRSSLVSPSHGSRRSSRILSRRNVDNP